MRRSDGVCVGTPTTHQIGLGMHEAIIGIKTAIHVAFELGHKVNTAFAS